MVEAKDAAWHADEEEAPTPHKGSSGAGGTILRLRRCIKRVNVHVSIRARIHKHQAKDGKGHPYPRIRRLVQSKLWENFMLVVIFLNAIVIGWQAVQGLPMKPEAKDEIRVDRWKEAYETWKEWDDGVKKALEEAALKAQKEMQQKNESNGSNETNATNGSNQSTAEGAIAGRLLWEDLWSPAWRSLAEDGSPAASEGGATANSSNSTEGEVRTATLAPGQIPSVEEPPPPTPQPQLNQTVLSEIDAEVQAASDLQRLGTRGDQELNFLAENIFTGIFTVELILSLMCYGWTMVLDSQNWLDLFLVLVAIFSTWVFGPLRLQVAILRKFSALRVLRLTRLARKLRLRPEFQEMWSIVKGVMDNVETLFWTYVLAAFMTFLFAVVMTNAIGKADAFQESEEAQKYWGSITKSMLTLFQLMTVDAWGEVTESVMQVRGWVGVMTVIYITIARFMFFNLVVAIIVDGCIEASQEYKEQQARLHEDTEEEEQQEKMVKLFEHVHVHPDGRMNKLDMLRGVKGKQSRRMLRDFDLLAEDLLDLFDMCDADGSGKVKREEFALALYHVQGEAKTKDIIRLEKEMRDIIASVEVVRSCVDVFKDRINTIEAQLARAHRDLLAFTRTIVRAKEAMLLAATSQAVVKVQG